MGMQSFEVCGQNPGCLHDIHWHCFWAIPHLFEGLFVISWENNRDCHITKPLSLKTMKRRLKEAYEIRGLERCRSTVAFFLEKISLEVIT